jgi:aminoglycoside 6'-N-acetyltransferase I
MTRRIEPLTQKYLEECADVLVAAFNAKPWNDRWTQDTAREELAWTLRVPGYAGLVCVDDGVLALATGYREPDDVRNVFYLKTFCVRPDVQGTGVGSELLGSLRDYLSALGVNTIYLLTSRGTPAERFYSRHGYTAKPDDIIMTLDWRSQMGRVSGRRSP